MSLRLYRPRSQFVRFLLVGAVGFLVDAGVLLLLIEVAGMSRLWARLPSFLTAVTVTWWIHRSFTFATVSRPSASPLEWLRFVLANAVGNGINLAVYAAMVGLFGSPPLAALATASIAAAIVNYRMSSQWVFGRN